MQCTHHSVIALFRSYIIFTQSILLGRLSKTICSVQCVWAMLASGAVAEVSFTHTSDLNCNRVAIFQHYSLSTHPIPSHPMPLLSKCTFWDQIAWTSSDISERAVWNCIWWKSKRIGRSFSPLNRSTVKCDYAVMSCHQGCNRVGSESRAIEEERLQRVIWRHLLVIRRNGRLCGFSFFE